MADAIATYIRLMAEVRLEVDAAHPPERVWRALTDAELLTEWFMSTDLEPREGARFTLDPGTLAGFLGRVAGELTEVVAPRRLVMLWQGEKLHTRVTWEITEIAGGCRVQVVQSGFIGAPATLRRRALRDTYTRLFAEQLPVLLDRLASSEFDLAGSGGALQVLAVGGGTVEPAIEQELESEVLGPPAELAAEPPLDPDTLRAAVPRQRRPPANVAVAAWSAGRTLTPPAAEPAPPSRGGPAEDVSSVAGVPARREAAGTAGPAESGARAGRPTGRWSRWQARLAVAPGWLRAIAIGTATAVLAVVVLAATVHTPGRDAGDGAPGAEDADRDGPGVARQPGNVTSHTGQAESPEAATAESPGGSPASPGAVGSPGAPAATGAEGSGDSPGQSDPSAEAGDPDDPQPVPEPTLTAELATAGLPLVGGRAVTVTVSNPGPGAAPGWEVTMDVGDQEVANIDGATYQRNGSQVVFTALAGELAGGGSTEFTFDVRAPALGLVGASDPTDCTIDGEPCG